ncbi:MAG: alkaline phosphatase family protein [Candidatus Sericytochromatia bacterium]
MLKRTKIIKLSFLLIVSLNLISCIEDPTAPNSEIVQTPVSISDIAKIPKPNHTVIVVLENHAYEQIIDRKSAPYINELADSGALFTESYGLTHPSQPNYIMLYSGSNQDVKDDKKPQNTPFSTPNLGASMLAANKTFVGYSEDLPSVGFVGDKYDQYASKHSPWVHWQGNGTNRLPAEVNQPLSNFPDDYNKLPDLSFVIPNMDDDMHNGIFTPIIKKGDDWLKNHLDGYIKWAKDNNSLFILTFDEDNRLHNNKVTTIFVGPMVKAGVYNEKINHYSILRTLEDMYKLPYIGASTNINPIVDCWNPIK